MSSGDEPPLMPWAGSAHPRAARRATLKALNDEDGGVRFDAAWALSRLGKDAVPGLVEAAHSDQKPLRLLAIRTLGRIGAEAHAAEASLTEALKDKDPEVRVEVVRSLGLIGAAGDATIEGVVAALGDDHGDVVAAARDALRRIGRRDPKPGTGRETGGRGADRPASQVLAGIGPASVDALVRLMDVGDLRKRQLVVQALGEIGVRRGRDPHPRPVARRERSRGSTR